MEKETDFLDRMKVEASELGEKIKKGMTFVMSNPKFNELDEAEKVLLTQQLNAMQLYSFCLTSRVQLAELKKTEEK